MADYSDDVADEAAKLQDEIDHAGAWDLEREAEVAMTSCAAKVGAKELPRWLNTSKNKPQLRRARSMSRSTIAIAVKICPGRSPLTALRSTASWPAILSSIAASRSFTAAKCRGDGA